MKKTTLALCVMLLIAFGAQAQHIPQNFGKGLNFYGKDSSFHVKFGFRFQNLYTGTWNVQNDDLGTITDHASAFTIRRSRLKFDGFAFSPKLKWKLELALSNNDMAGGATTKEMGNASNLVLDAYADWNFYKGWTLRFGQAKLPGNIERVISSANMQLVDRSLVNAAFNIDRDLGIQLLNTHKVFGDFYMKEKFAFGQGEGRNITRGAFKGYDYTARVEFLPFGLFKGDKDDYNGSALTYYKTPKLMLGVGYDVNDNAVRNRGQLGSFITDAAGVYYGKQLNTLFADAALKYKRFSLMTEYMNKKTSDNIAQVYDAKNAKIGTFTTGQGINVQAGILLNKNVSSMTGDIELVGRITSVDYTNGTNDENQYTIGVNRFVSGHQLKIQADMTYRTIIGGDDRLMFRTQLDVHF